jgi:hypothetical protein
MTMSGTARRPQRRAVWEVLAVGVLGLTFPMFISTPLSVADTHFVTGGVPSAPVSAHGR